MIGTAVHDEGVGGQVRGDRTGHAVRQGEEDDVMTGERRGIRRLKRQVRERAQVRLQRDERLARIGVRGHGRDLELRVGREEPQELAPA
jgi:hypothetical protein